MSRKGRQRHAKTQATHPGVARPSARSGHRAARAGDGVSGFTARGVAQAAQTSTPAVYGLSGDKGGLIRELFFEGFRLLHRHLESFVESARPFAPT